MYIQVVKIPHFTKSTLCKFRFQCFFLKEKTPKNTAFWQAKCKRKTLSKGRRFKKKEKIPKKKEKIPKKKEKTLKKKEKIPKKKEKTPKKTLKKEKN